MQTSHPTRRGTCAQALVCVSLVSFLIGTPVAAAPPERLSGVWVGSIALDGLIRPLVLQLEERTDGRLIGYVLGHPGAATIASGSALHKELSAQLEITTASAKRQVSIAGRLRGRNLIQADATTGGSSQPVRFTRAEGNLRERRFWVAVPAAGGGDFIVNEVVTLADDASGFVSGAFAGIQTCALWSCEGRLDSFSATADGNTLDFTFHSSDPCSAGSSAHLVFDAVASTYSGNFILRTCASPETGDLLGVKQPGTQSSDVAQILARLANLADDFETPTPFASTHASFSNSYRDWGLNLAALLNRYSQEKVRYASIDASFSRIADITTLIDPGTWPEFQRPFGARLVERRSGVPVGGTTRAIYVDSENTPDRPLLWRWSQEPRGWVIRGNGADALDFPFAYSVTPDGLAYPSDGAANRVKVSLGPFGPHFAHVTGHAIGDRKANLVGFFTGSDSDLTEIAPGVFAYYGGVGGTELLARRPLYRSPAAGLVTRISCDPSGPALNGQANWRIEINLPTGEKLGFGHTGEFHVDLRDTVLSATDIDIHRLTCPPGGMENVLASDAVIPVARHASLGWPQVVATPVAGHIGYYVGGGGVPDRPWAQMEFFFDAQVSSSLPGEFSRACFYNYLDPTLTGRLQSAMLVDMTDPASQRYRSFQGPDWRWRMNAESRLCMAPSAEPRDFHDLYTNLGGWYERDGPGPLTMDEIVGFAPIAKDAGLYDPSEYFSPATSMLLARRKKSPLSFAWNLPDRGPAPVAVPYPDGEIVERTTDTLLIHWRNLFPASPALRQDYWQRATYSLDATGLRIVWGVFALDPTGAVSPGSAPGILCDGVSVVCYNHEVHNFAGF